MSNPARTRSVLFAFALGLIAELPSGSVAPPAAHAARPLAKQVVVARPARRLVAPRARRKQATARLIRKLGRAKEAATRQAERDVGRMDADRIELFGFQDDRRDLAIKARKNLIFTRNSKRILTAAELVEKLIALEEKATTPDQVRRLEDMQADVMHSAFMNRKLGTEKNGWRKLKRIMHLRLPRLVQRFIPFLRRDTQWSPGTIAYNVGARDGMENTDRLDPVDSTMWRRPRPERVTSEALFAGPWMKSEKRPTLPGEETVLELDDFRSFDADGIHPSVFVTDPVTKTEWKVKFTGGLETPVSTEPMMSRVYYAIGYHSAPVYHAASLRMDPRALIAAYKYKQRLGIRIRENSFWNRILRIPAGKYGFPSPYRMENQVREVVLQSGQQLRGAAAAAYVKRAGRSVRLLRSIAYVTVGGVDIALKGEGGGESIGPFNPEDPLLADRREVRALATISQAWAMGDDMRFNNLRLDVEEENGEYQLRHTMSDAGAHFQTSDLNALDWEVELHRDGPRLHNDVNGFTLRAYDRSTIDDARWAARTLATLTREQWIAIAAAEAESWPVARLYAEKMMSRRDSLVRQTGLAREIPPLLPNGPDRRMTLAGKGTVRLTDANGNESVREVPSGDFKVVDGRVVPASDG